MPSSLTPLRSHSFLSEQMLPSPRDAMSPWMAIKASPHHHLRLLPPLTAPSCSRNSRSLRLPTPTRKVMTGRTATAHVASAKPDGGVDAAMNAPSDNRMLVFVPPHPLIKHWMSVLRNEATPSPIFKSAMAELGRLLIYEASRDWLPTISGEIQSPMGIAAVEFIDPREPITLIPILRAGLALVEHTSSILPATQTYHLGMKRDEETLLPSVYLNNLPEKLPEGSRVLIVDPMLATGGSIVAAVDLLKERGVGNKQIRIISAVAAPPALQKLSNKFPGIRVYTAIIDPEVNEKGFIVPGLGDAGDRIFGT